MQDDPKRPYEQAATSDSTARDPVTGPTGGSGTSNKDHDIRLLRRSEQRNLAISILLALLHLVLGLLVDCLELVNFLLAVLHALNAGFTYRTLQATNDPVTGEPGSSSNTDHDTGG